MKVFLLNANVEPTTLEKATSVLIGFGGNTNHAIVNPGLADSDLIICDSGNISGDFSGAINNQHHNILKRIKGGAVLLVFAGKPDGNNYTWLNSMGIQLAPEYLAAREITFSPDFVFSNFFKKWEKKFIHHSLFNKFPSGEFHRLAVNKSDDLVGIYGTYGKGHMFIIPRPDNISQFTKEMVDEVFPLLNVDFLPNDGSKEPIPDEIALIPMPGRDKILEKIKKEENIIEIATNTKIALEDNLSLLDKWKDLLWQTGTPLENIVKRFFEEIMGINLTKTEIDLTGEYEGKELFIEVKGNTGVISHNKDFRQIHERKFYNAKDPQNTIALLVGNPFRLLPLNQRPPEHESLFAKTSIPVAEASLIGLVHTKELFQIVNDILENPKTNRKKILSEIMNSKGIFTYKI